MTPRALPIEDTMDRGQLNCPSCGGIWTHVDEVTVAARHEDREPDPVHVHAITGAIKTRPDVELRRPPSTAARSARRHWLQLDGTCETCEHRFAIVVTQEKGCTIVEVAVDPHLGE